MSQNILIPTQHPHSHRLTRIIQSFSLNNKILRVFMSFSNACQKYLLIIHLDSSNVPKEIIKAKWITKAFLQLDTHVILLGRFNINPHLRLGSLFITRHCNSSTFIYKEEHHEFTYSETSKQLKKFKGFKNDYYHKQDLLTMEIRKAKNNSAMTMQYHLYKTLFEHHLFHLELLCMGDYYSGDSLDVRFLRLEEYLPELKNLLVKKTGTSYFLTNALESAELADKNDDCSYLQDEFAETMEKVEHKLYNMVVNIFCESKKEVKKLPLAPILVEKEVELPYEQVVKILNKYFQIQEIFLYHQLERFSDDRKTIVLYLLLISEKIGNQDLFEMMQIVSQQTEGKFSIFPVAHSKAWIQEHLFSSQAFFQKIMTPENSIYTEDIPTLIHWHEDSVIYGDDDKIHHRCCKELYENYMILRTENDLNSSEGLGLLLSAFFYRACSTMIYVSLNYHHNAVNIRILWKLCEYIDPKIKQLDYLIEKLPFDFFIFLNPSKNLFKNFYYLKESNLLILDELAESFLSIINGHLKEKQ